MRLYSVRLFTLTVGTVSATIKPIRVRFIHINAHSQHNERPKNRIKKSGMTKSSDRYADMMSSDIVAFNVKKSTLKIRGGIANANRVEGIKRD